VPFALLGAGAGLALGLLTAALTHVEVDKGRLVTRTGAAFAAVWIAVVGGRLAFAYGATHLFPSAVAHFSAAHAITGSGAWAAMFVLMALGMVVGRLGVLGIQVLKRQPVLAAA
jgi:hypothetical protein